MPKNDYNSVSLVELAFKINMHLIIAVALCDTRNFLE